MSARRARSDVTRTNATTTRTRVLKLELQNRRRPRPRATLPTSSPFRSSLIWRNKGDVDPSREAVPNDAYDDDVDPFDDDDDAGDDTPRCPPDCPGCRGAASGGRVCVTTGNRVFPPMTLDGARGLAQIVLNFIGLIVRFVRDDKRLIVPTDPEIDALAEAIREMCHRRASWVSAIDDLIAFGYNATRYTMRAVREPARAKVAPKGTPAKRWPSRDELERADGSSENAA